VLQAKGVSLTCEVSAELGVEWFLTKESGRVPVLCTALRELVQPLPGVLSSRPRSSLFVVKVMGQREQCEVLAVPFLLSTVEWFQEHALRAFVEGVTCRRWARVVHVAVFLECKSSCLQGCKDCRCAERHAWSGCGWRRIAVPQLDIPRHIGWWKGVTDAVGNLPRDGDPWLRCPCSAAHDLWVSEGVQLAF
jgi:hypothetical protein